jgi:tetratricopeptide (TPR) repeat protein
MARRQWSSVWLLLIVAPVVAAMAFVAGVGVTAVYFYHWAGAGARIASGEGTSAAGIEPVGGETAGPVLVENGSRRAGALLSADESASRALKLLDAAEHEAGRVADPDERAARLLKVGKARLREGQSKEAVATLVAAAGAARNGELVAEVAEARVSAGDVSGAMETVEALARDRLQMRVLAAVGGALLRKHDLNGARAAFERARKWPQSSGEYNSDVEAHVWIARAQEDSGDLSYALDWVSRDLDMLAQKYRSLDLGALRSELAIIHARMGHVDEAKGVLSDVGARWDEQATRSRALAALAAAQAEKGAYDDALVSAGQIRDEGSAAMAFGEVVRCWALAGDPDRASAVVSRHWSPAVVDGLMEAARSADGAGKRALSEKILHAFPSDKLLESAQPLQLAAGATDGLGLLELRIAALQIELHHDAEARSSLEHVERAFDKVDLKNLDMATAGMLLSRPLAYAGAARLRAALGDVRSAGALATKAARANDELMPEGGFALLAANGTEGEVVRALAASGRVSDALARVKGAGSSMFGPARRGRMLAGISMEQIRLGDKAGATATLAQAHRALLEDGSDKNAAAEDSAEIVWAYVHLGDVATAIGEASAASDDPGARCDNLMGVVERLEAAYRGRPGKPAVREGF